MNYIMSEMKNISTDIINKTVSNELSNFNDNLIYITKNSNDEIQTIDYNSNTANKILVSITDDILNNLKSLENDLVYTKESYSKGVIYTIPLGSAFENVFIGNLGPKIPVKLNIVGNVHSNIKTNVKEYGINNALIEILISVSVNEKVIIPFMSDNINISIDIPISMRLVQGKVPEYYGGFFSKNSGILSIPSE